MTIEISAFVALLWTKTWKNSFPSKNSLPSTCYKEALGCGRQGADWATNGGFIWRTNMHCSCIICVYTVYMFIAIIMSIIIVYPTTSYGCISIIYIYIYIYVEFQGVGFLSMFGIHAFNLSKPVYPRSPTWSQPTDPVHIFQLQEPSSPAEACGKGHHANTSKHADGIVLTWGDIIPTGIISIIMKNGSLISCFSEPEWSISIYVQWVLKNGWNIHDDWI